MSDEEQRRFGIDKLNVVRSEIPAVTHVDYSARVQTVRREDEPLFHALLSRFEAKTGCPVPVCFTLPACPSPCQVTCTKNAVRFDYGKSLVVLRFRHNGTITVHDRD